MTALIFTFVLGIANFALHKAVLESGHPLLGRMPFMNMLGPRASLAAEFVVLLGALLLVSSGNPAWAWAYLGYTAVNGIAAWLILTRRV
jgi:heme/copper-type cytochrome/quinol oxidase subunit 3